ncbi:hypothetical protein ARALYDRAFT_912984 [Arabidopsis lyrata subsp. lyrata]|uniref:F-box domain-containing protein n=1 Tax=Arabidopsis lyrata subsp. lyrata TaxID=81972 RepID=D7MF50_ARALL|nr:hypothetical protein ARALYDRAFT_912984 [Arabidopsis lyrata subsp. lyrata]
MTKFSELPTDVIISCVARVPINNYRVLSLISKLIASMITSSELFVARSAERSKETLVYCCFTDLNQVPR